MLLNKLENVIYDKGRFHNDHGKGYYASGYPYGREFPENANDLICLLGEAILHLIPAQARK